MKYFFYPIAFLLMTACATSRQKTLDKQENKTSVQNQTDYAGTSDVSLKSKTSNYSVDDLSQTNVSIKPLFASDKCSNSAITITDKNGRQAVIPVLPNAETTLSSQQQNTRQENHAEQDLKASKEENMKLKQKIETLQKLKNLNVHTERNSFWLYVLIFLGGGVFVLLIQWLFRRLINSQWYFQLLAKLKKG